MKDRQLRHRAHLFCFGVLFAAITSISAAPAHAGRSPAREAAKSSFYKLWSTHSRLLDKLRSYGLRGKDGEATGSVDSMLENWKKVPTLAKFAKLCGTSFKVLWEEAPEEVVFGQKASLWCKWITNPKPLFVDQTTAQMLYKASIGWLKRTAVDYRKKGFVNQNVLAKVSNVRAYIKQMRKKFGPIYAKFGAKFSNAYFAPLLSVKADLDKAFAEGLDKWTPTKKFRYDRRVARLIKKKYPKVPSKGAYAGKKLRIQAIVFASTGWGWVTRRGRKTGRHRRAWIMGKYPGDKYCVWLSTSYTERLLPNGRYERNGHISWSPDVRYGRCKKP